MSNTFTVPLTPEQRLQAELAAIAERRDEAKRTNRAAIALFREVAATPGVHVGRVQGRDTSGRFAADGTE